MNDWIRIYSTEKYIDFHVKLPSHDVMLEIGVALIC